MTHTMDHTSQAHRDRLEAYLEPMAPLARGRARSALERQMRLDGVHGWRYAVAETLAADAGLRFDDEKGRLHTGRGTFYTYGDLSRSLVEYLRHLVAARAADAAIKAIETGLDAHFAQSNG